mgnify:CR=1 FL=1
MANLQNADLKPIRSLYDQIDDLMLENKRLKKLVNDLQREYMNRISELAEIHPMEDK